MRLLVPLRCAANWHRPRRQAISWNGQHYYGTCVDCGMAIHRIGRGQWRVDQREGPRLNS